MTMTTTAPLVPPAPATLETPDDTAALTPIRIPVIAWVALVLTLMWIVYAFVGQNLAPDVWMHIHEYFHDGRHFLGIACH